MEAFSREFPGGESLCRDWIEAAATFPADTPLIDYVRKASPGRSVKELTEMKPSTLKKLANQIHETEFLNAISERLADRLKGENEATRANLFGNLKSYHTGLQSTKMKNPQVPFIAKKTLTRAETVAAVRGFMSVEMEPAEAEEYLSGLRKCTGRFAKKYAVGQKRKAWNGQRLVVGEFVRRRDASLLYDKETESLVLAVKSNKFGERLDVQRYIYADGTSLLSDLQLVSAKGAPKKCFIFPLLAKHDFLRYYTKNIRNHDPDADLEQRAFCSSVKVFLLEQSADGKPARVFLRPNFSFYRPNYPSISPQPEPVENQANYVIGIDRGVNSDLEAIVLDVRAKAIISRFGGSSRKEEWEIVRAQLAAATSRRDQIRNENPKGSNWSKRLDRANRALKLIRSKDRRLSQVSVVESVMSIVTTCEAQFGRGNYIIALENLGNMNVKRLNRVVSFAKVRAAFDQGLQRLGYSKADSQVPSPLRFVVARGTSQESIFTDWVANKENVASATAELNRPVGRYIGRDYLRFQDGVAKRKRKGDLGRTIGNQLFCNPFCEHYNGIEFPGGVIINADVQAAINIAVRVLFPKPMADCDAHERRKLVEFRSELRFEGWSPELFRFCGPAADPFAEIRSV